MKYPKNIYKTAIKLKRLKISEIAKHLKISMRMLEYYMKGEKMISKETEFLELLEPELTELANMALLMLYDKQKGS
ncbi:MAG: hypothetical protein K8S56_04655 [Candidatus Cloacimonetes bacterium]|nr:hypothetical protein [Candidatus Cloacimonadota bacterium]